jgi:Kef-type K+ transport system membrane component KefB
MLTLWLESVRSVVFQLPTLVKFVAALLMILGVTPICRRLHVPSVVGLLLCGILVGPYGFRVIGNDSPVVAFLAELGRLFLMFFAGLEIDLNLFREARSRSIAFGIATTIVPLFLGTIVGLAFGYEPIAAVVIGSLLASHTLLANTFLMKIGAMRLEPITVTVGATMISDMMSLIIFAVCAQTYVSGFSPSKLLLQLGEIVLFIPFLLLGLGRLGGFILKRVEKDDDSYFLLMLLIVGLAALLSRVIHLPDIVGGFLAGVALNSAVKGKIVKDRFEFFGTSLFIPLFFISIGFLIKPSVFIHSIISRFSLALSIVLSLVVGKWIAAEAVGRAFHYPSVARKTMWSMTLPQVAATLAVTLVAFNTFNPEGKRLLDQQMMNVVLVLVFVTSVLGPMMTERFAPRLELECKQRF